MALLPQPDNLDTIKYLHSTNMILNSSDRWKARHDKIWYTIDKLQINGYVDHKTDEYEILNAHMFLRAFNQANEACNRLWATIELSLHAENEGLFCDKFNKGFLTTSIVPTLHYANITSIISILSLYGVCSLRQPHKPRDFMNLIRCGDSIHLVKRKDYIKELSGSGKKQWHIGIFTIYEALLKHGIKIPAIDLTDSYDLLKARNALDYDLLGQTTMGGAFGEDIYLSYLPYVCNNLECAIVAINAVVGNMSNEADSRFYQLKENVGKLVK